jgi:phospholipid/cholesterol/gamma-HCH transport system permease protein
MKFFRHIGEIAITLMHTIGGIYLLTRQTLAELVTRPFYPDLVAEQIVVIGIESLLLVAITGVTCGAVMTLQFGYGLAKFGGKLYIPKVMGMSLIREMGPVFTSLMVAGRMGSGMAAEIGSMKVTQQIDAIRALGTSPIKRIVIPRLLAMLICLPLLTLIADVCGSVSGVLVGSELGLGAHFFWEKIYEGLVWNDYWTGTVKTLFFGFFITMIGCYRGLNTEGGTRGVGNSTQWVVVASSITIFVSDFFLTKLFIAVSQ